MSVHPTKLARAIAQDIEDDPIAARQIKGFIPEARLIEMLEINVPGHKTIEEAVAYSDFNDDEVLDYVLKRFKDREILEAMNPETVREFAKLL